MIRKLLKLAILLLVVAVSGSFWYARTSRHCDGNPIYPLSLVVGGEVVRQGIHDDLYRSDRFPGHHIPDDIQSNLDANKWGTLWDGLGDPLPTIGGEDTKLGGWGPVWGVVMVPSVLFCVAWSLLKRRWDVLVWLIGWGVSVWLFPFPTWARFVLPCVMCGCVGTGIMLEFMDTRLRGRLFHSSGNNTDKVYWSDATDFTSWECEPEVMSDVNNGYDL